MKSSNSRIVLLVSDDSVQIRAFSSVLRQDGMKVLLRRNVSEAFTVLKARPPDIIITRLLMNDIDGWRFFRLLRSPVFEPFNRIPVIVISSTLADHGSNFMFRPGIDAVLPDGTVPSQLLGCVRELLDGRAWRLAPSVVVVGTSGNARTVGRFFEKKGHEVRYASDDEGAREEMTAHHPEIIILFDGTEKVSSAEFLDECRRLYHGVCRIVVMKTPDPALALSYTCMGAVACLCAPAPPGMVYETAREAFGVRALLESERHRPTTDAAANDGRTFQSCSKPILNAEGKVVEVVPTMTDIYDRKKAEQERIEREERLKSIFRAAPIIVGVVTDRIITDINDRIFEMTGYRQDELIGKSSRVLYPDDFEFERVGTEKYRVMAQKGVGAMETTWKRKDGGLITVFLSSSPIFPGDISKGVTFSAIDITMSKRAEAALKESEARFRLLVESAPDAVYVQAGGAFAYVNSEAVRLFGARSREELLGRPFLERFHPRFHGAVRERMRLINEERIPLRRVEQTCLRMDGTPVPVEASATPISYGGFDGALVFARDISERNRAEEIIVQSGWLLSSIREAQNLYIEGGDAGRVFQTLLETLVEITGSEYGYLHEIIRPLDTGACLRNLALTNISWDEDSRRLYRSLVESGGTFHNLNNLIGAPVVTGDLVIANDAPRHHLSGGTPQGHPPIRSYMGIPMFFGGELVGVAGIANREGGYSEGMARFLEPFISTCATVIHAFRKDREQDAAMKALRERDERFRKLAENIREVFWIASLDGKTLEYVSPAYEDIWGRSSDSLYRNPRRWLKTVAGSDRSEILDKLRRETSGDWKRIELPSFRITRPDGTLRWIKVHGYPVRDSGGKALLMAGIAEDITEKKKVEEERALLMEQLHQAQKMEAIGQLAGGVAHDFNNILTATIGCSQLLLKKLPPVSALRSHVEMILSSGKKAAGLTQSLLAFGRKQNVELKPVNANEVITKVAKLLSRLIGEDIDLRLELLGTPLVINADILQIEQILMNLAINARDAMPCGGTITLRTDRVHLDQELINAYCRDEPGHYAVISFSDTGTGIPHVILDRIFEPFFTTKEAGKGTGLGLSIVHGIVKQHGGYIGVESIPGQGTTFLIHLPIVEEENNSTPELEQNATEAGNGTILIAEDDATVRMLLKMILEENGYVCIEAADGQETVEFFRQQRDEIDLVILDVVMPRMNGGIAFQEIRKIRPDVRVLFISGYTRDLINQKGILDSTVKFVSKPITPTELLHHVQEILRG